MAHDESDDVTIARALAVLNGQGLTSVEVDARTGSSTFAFGLGCFLVTRPAADGEPLEQWMLYQPSGDVQPGTLPDDGALWAPLPAE